MKSTKKVGLSMKLRKTLLIVPTLIASISLSGCSIIRNILSNFFNKENIALVTLDKSPLEYTYKEYNEHNLYNIDNCPLEGSPKLLVVPVWFTDSSNYISSSEKSRVRNDIEKAYFGSSSDTGWRSVATYYHELSQGKLDLQGVVTDWFSCDYSSKNFYDAEAGMNHTCQLVYQAVDWYKSTSGNTVMSDFDLDKNGYLDGVMLIYAAPDGRASSNDAAENMWAYCYWLQEVNENLNKPIPNVFFWASYDFMYGSNSGVGSYFGGDTNNARLDTHTFIHEMGHVLGLEDYYDYSDTCCPSAGFSMQDYNVGSHDPYSTMAFGWVNPIIPTETCKIKIKPFQDKGHDLILLSSSSNVFSPFDEYLLLELYTPTGLNAFDSEHALFGRYPKGPNKAGIRLWHVDARLTYATGDNSYSHNLVSDIQENKRYTHAMKNTSWTSNDKTNVYCSILGQDYAKYDLLHLIRNNKRVSYKTNTTLAPTDLFVAGSSFSMDDYKSQFANGNKLDSNESLGWSFKVNSVSSSEATITLYKK